MKNLNGRIIIISFILIYAQNANCQKTGNVYFFVSPENSIIRIDTALFTQKKEIVYMAPGKYPVRMWAPKRKLVNDTLIVRENSVTLFRKKLPYTTEYKSYRIKNIKYKTTKGIMRYIGVPLTTIFAFNSYNSYKSHSNQADIYLERANKIKNSFPALLTMEQINDARLQFIDYSSKYDMEIDDANKKMKKTQIIIGSGIIFTAALNYCTKFLHKPSYNETPLLSDIGMEVNQFGNISVSLHLNISGK